MRLMPSRQAPARPGSAAKPARAGEGPSAPVVLSLIGALAVVGGASISAWVADRAAARAFDAKMVEIGVGILATDPGKSDVTAARQWALDLVEKHSGLTFSADGRARLLHSPLVAPGAMFIGGMVRAAPSASATVTTEPPQPGSPAPP